MQSDMLAKCIAISRSHFLNVPYKDLVIWKMILLFAEDWFYIKEWINRSVLKLF